jgi:hypothetical protein
MLFNWSAAVMGDDEIAQARRLAAHALSRAQTTADRRQQKLWQEIADAWISRAAALEHRKLITDALPPRRPANKGLGRRPPRTRAR